MAVLLAEDIEKAFGDRHILRGITLSVEPGEHLGLVGVNGGGKSTLLRIIAGEIDPDHGRLVRRGRVSMLSQEPDFTGETVEDAVRAAVAWHDELLAAWQQALERHDTAAVEALQARIDHHGWQVEHRIDAVLDKLRAPARAARLDTLSGGERRRLALATVLLEAPDILLLDEPTNHLDADTVEWLEAWITGHRGAVVLVTHDRYLLEAVADRIVEVDQGKAVSYDGSYADYLIARAERHARLEQERERHLSLIAREAAWASRSPSARRTKQKARLGRLDELKAALPTVEQRDYAFVFETGVPKGSTLVELHGAAKGFGGRTLFSSVDLTVRPGDRIGILGPNGAGKSTLLKLMMGELAPDAGQVLRGPRLKVGVLDQARSGLDDDETVLENAGDGRLHLVLNGQEIHVAGFLQRFAFAREMFEQKAGALSGGERARLLLARLMLGGANLLVLDEPTNDLDLLTLRTLEEALLGFDGGVVVVTHDRAFLDRVCTQVVAFEDDGRVVAYASRQQHVAALEARRRAEAPPPPPPVAEKPKPVSASTSGKRLSFRERQELDALPERIEALEAELGEIEAALGDPATYKDRGDEVAALTARSEALPGEIEGLYARWEALSERA